MENLRQTGSELYSDVSCHQDYIFSDLVYESPLNAKQFMGVIVSIQSMKECDMKNWIKEEKCIRWLQYDNVLESFYKAYIGIVYLIYIV